MQRCCSSSLYKNSIIALPVCSRQSRWGHACASASIIHFYPGSPSAWLIPALHALVYGKQSALHCSSARSVQGWHLTAGAVSTAAAAQPALRNSGANREADTLPKTSPEQSCQHYRTTESCNPSCPGQHCVGLSPAAQCTQQE